ncbi:hypothetical protein RDWZM_002474 [Blomia tropicalis]|uniref:Nucleolar protein 14 n=1 Tax=Blomia tropicalis TaxID=40697 RepID=A0A9Q0RRK8_BLOTA|nr:hypothetical protein RDWZM_002474 [Blomia tropicalis]
MTGRKKLRNNVRVKLELKKREESVRKNETNPFELKRNKIKHQILGRKIAKNELGKPLLNRSRAYQKRSQTLLEEYRNKHKGGKGVQDFRTAGKEDRVISKYKESQEKINFNRGEHIELTHKGKPLEDFIDDRLSSDDEDIDIFNRDDFVERTHFGGGVDGAPRSSREVLQDIMSEKHKIKMEKEEAIQLTEKLDTQWTELKSLLKHKGGRDSHHKSENRDDYDTLLSQLMFEGKKSTTQENSTHSDKVTEVDKSKTELSVDGQFREKLEMIGSTNDIEIVMKLLKEAVALLPNVTRKSFDLLKERLLNLTKLSNIRLTPKELSIFVCCSYYKQLQTVLHLLVTKTINRLKYSNFLDVAVALFLLNILLHTVEEGKLYPEMFINVHNLVRLCMPDERVQLTRFNRLQYETESILSVRFYADIENISMSEQYRVNPSSLFSNIFRSTTQPLDQKLVSYSLSIQVIQLVIALFDKYSKMTIIGQLMALIDRDISVLSKIEHVPDEMKSLLKKYNERFVTKPSSMIINRILPKPIIMPMLEPKFDETSGRKCKDNPRLLTRKFKREMKGAQREIRKDASFLRDTYLKEVNKKDRARKQKVNEILRDLSVQQGLYKKK